MEPEQPDDVLTVEQAAALIGIAPQTLSYYIRSNRLPARKLGRSWQVRREDAEHFKRELKK
jgi:excisionase family DNA binding protein